uniref:Uncharacterized protein n=1 Tax=Rhodnius prolixus TaxID=13249 RepID=T1I2F5_RHOPR
MASLPEVLFAAMFLLEAIMCGTVKKRSSNDDEEEEKDEVKKRSSNDDEESDEDFRFQLEILFAAMFLVEAIMCATVMKRQSNDDEEKDERNLEDIGNIYEKHNRPYFIRINKVPFRFLEGA